LHCSFPVLTEYTKLWTLWWAKNYEQFCERRNFWKSINKRLMTSQESLLMTSLEYLSHLVINANYNVKVEEEEKRQMWWGHPKRQKRKRHSRTNDKNFWRRLRKVCDRCDTSKRQKVVLPRACDFVNIIIKPRSTFSDKLRPLF